MIVKDTNTGLPNGLGFFRVTTGKPIFKNRPYNLTDFVFAPDRSKARWEFYKKHFPGQKMADIPSVRTKKIPITQNIKVSKLYDDDTTSLFRITESDKKTKSRARRVEYVVAESASKAKYLFYQEFYADTKMRDVPSVSVVKIGIGFTDEPGIVTDNEDFKEYVDVDAKTIVNTPRKDSFTRFAKDLAGSVWDFHKEWNVGSRNYGDASKKHTNSVLSALSERHEILTEEVDELREAIRNGDTDNAIEELVDVLYVALGSLEAVGENGFEAIEQVIAKNKAKTAETHEMDDKPPFKIRRKSDDGESV